MNICNKIMILHKIHQDQNIKIYINLNNKFKKYNNNKKKCKHKKNNIYNQWIKRNNLKIKILFQVNKKKQK